MAEVYVSGIDKSISFHLDERLLKGLLDPVFCQQKERKAIFHYFFPEGTEAEMGKIFDALHIDEKTSKQAICDLLDLYRRDQKLAVETANQAAARKIISEQAAGDMEKVMRTMETVKQETQAAVETGKATRKPRKGKKHKCKSGELEKIHAKFKKLRGNDAPHKNTIGNWIHGKTTPPEGFLTALKSKDPYALDIWINDEYDKPEQRRSGKPIAGMTDEEIHRKRKP